MGIYKFEPEDAERFAKHIGIASRHRGKQLEFVTCPYCKAQDKWTFGISLETGQFECKRATCGTKGNMITLSKDFNFSLGKDADTYYRTCDYSKKQYKEFREAHKPLTVLPEAVEYLKGRGISEDIIQKYEVTARTDNNKVLLFPFRDESGALTFIKYRNTDFKKGETKGSKEWCAPGRKPILFGMNHCNPEADNGDLIITEGQIDSLSVAMAGYTNAVSVPIGCNGFTWIPHCYDFMNKFQRIIVMGDCENGKITLSEELSKRWPTKTRVCRPEDYRECKDANEILQKYGVLAIREAISRAAAPYNSHIKPLAKVQQVDIMKMESFRSGIETLDKLLDGGFRFGQLAVLTGKRGEGKSTIASMIGVRALAQGYSCFFYSGELMDFYFRNWMDCQVTGKLEHLASEHDKLDLWYGDRAYIYDDTIITDDELTDLPKTIETAIIQNDCKFIMVDNLMTAMTDDLSVDLYRSQSNFVGRLATIAKKYNVFVLLVCHPRKTNQQLSNDDVSGSSNITDKADLVLTFGRIKDGPPDARKICITKNRLTGKITDTEGIRLVYDQKSRRLAEHSAEFRNIRFDWNADPYGFEEVDDEDLEVIPF